MRVFAICALGSVAGCVVTTSTPDDKPSRVIGHIAPHIGYASVQEDAPDGPSGPGPAFGVHGGVMYRLDPTIAVGVGLDVAISAHDTATEPRTATFWTFMLPVLVARKDLGRFALATWGGYYMGFRSISEPGGTFGTRTHSSVKTHGTSLALAALVRWKPAPNAPSIEIGPFAQLQWMVAKADDTRTDFDEAGLLMRSVAFGIMLQTAFGSPPIAGDTF